MKILTRYILKQMVVSFTLILCGLTALVWLTQSLRMIDMIVTKGVPVRIFLEMTLLVLPNFIQILSPLALFAVILFIFSRMQSDKEIMVMQAVGMSNAQIMFPAVVLSLCLTVICYVLTLQVIPRSYAYLSELRWKVRNDLSHLLLQEGQFNSLGNGVTLYIRERAGDGSVLGVMAYDAKDPQNVSILVAQKGYIFQQEDGFQLVFQKGTRQEFNPKTKEFSILKFNKYNMFFNDKKKTNTPRAVAAGEYTLSYLLKVKKKEVADRVLYRKYKTEALKRLTKPLYNITFMFLAIFAVLTPFYNRRGQVGRVNFVILGALLVQSLALAFENLTAKNLWCAPLLFLNILLPILMVSSSMFQWRLSAKNKEIADDKTEKKTSAGKVLTLLFICFFAMSAQAQVKVDPQVHFEKDKPVDFEADNISYDKQQDTITAWGDVVIEQNGTIIKTQKFIFDRKANQLYLPQEVEIITPDGSKTYVEDAVLRADLKEALGNTITIRLYEGSLIRAKRMKRTDEGDSLYLKRVKYTACSFCAGETPLWEVTAQNMKHDVPNKEMRFIHSFLDIKDIPVFYFPYLNIPDFTVKRKTGLLAPSLSHGKEMKQGINLPFFVDVADNQNLTVTPTFSVSHDPLAMADYTGLFTRGALSFNASATRDNDGTNQGHIKAKMRLDATDAWRLQGQYYRTITDTYFRRYSLQGVDRSDQYLTSYVTAERFGEQNYFNFTGYSYQSLLSNMNPKSIPVFIPTMDYKLNSDTIGGTGIYAYSDINGSAYNNRLRFKSNRLSVTQGLRAPVISDTGFVVDTKTYMRADGYSVDTGKNSFSTMNPDTTYSTGRVQPVVSSKISYPLARSGQTLTQVLEPIVMVVSSPNQRNKEKIPNIDSLDLDFDDTNLFSENRFTGYDRVETGTRANYGIQYSVYGSKNRSMSFLFGQSYRFSGDELVDDILGFESNYSDYVGRWQANYDILTFVYRFRLDEKSWEPIKNEVTVSGGWAPLRLGVDYVQLKSKTKLREYRYYRDREEVLFFGSSQLSKNWSLSGYYRYNLEKTSTQKGPVETGAIAQYDNDCTAIALDISKSFTHDRDYDGDTSVMLKFVLKTLGNM